MERVDEIIAYNATFDKKSKEIARELFESMKRVDSLGIFDLLLGGDKSKDDLLLEAFYDAQDKMNQLEADAKEFLKD